MALKYAVEQRLRLIDFLLFHYGSVSRAEVQDYFGTAPSCATRDFREYEKLAPGNAVLDQSSKRYVKGCDFKRAFP